TPNSPPWPSKPPTTAGTPPRSMPCPCSETCCPTCPTGSSSGCFKRSTLPCSNTKPTTRSPSGPPPPPPPPTPLPPSSPPPPTPGPLSSPKLASATSPPTSQTMITLRICHANLGRLLRRGLSHERFWCETGGDGALSCVTVSCV